jgi:hypothetical protein
MPPRGAFSDRIGPQNGDKSVSHETFLTGLVPGPGYGDVAKREIARSCTSMCKHSARLKKAALKRSQISLPKDKQLLSLLSPKQAATPVDTPKIKVILR